MKKIVLLIAVLLISASSLLADNYGALKLGFHAPDATDAGFIIGGEYGVNVDESLDVGLSFDWFQKEFSETTTVLEQNNAGINTEVKKKLSETTLYSFPVMAVFTGRFELQDRLNLLVSGSLGMELLMADYDISSEYAEIAPDLEDTTEWGFDFNWRVGAGVGYRLGSRSEITGELSYHGSKPTVELEGDLEREYDMSGMMGRVGIKFYL